MTMTPIDDPFGYEIRVHLFARNRNLGRARGHEPGSFEHAQRMTNAWRQNLILENYFGNTLEQSTFDWGPQRRKQVEVAQDPEAVFVSRVAAHLITGVSEGRLRVLMLALLAALIVCDVVVLNRPQPESPPG